MEYSILDYKVKLEHQNWRSSLRKRRRFGTKDHEALLVVLRELRERAGMTQIGLAKALGSTQSFVSKIELGERKLDVLDARRVVNAMDVSFTEFAKMLDDRLSNQSSTSKKLSSKQKSE